jgi:hypothetical protein
MINWQETLLFPVRDSDARRQFLFACLVTLAGFIIPLLPTFVLMGYSIKIMRHVLDERKPPAMPDWQNSDWSQMFMDGLKLFGIQILLASPLILCICSGMTLMIFGSMGIPIAAEQRSDSFLSLGLFAMIIGGGFTMLSGLLSFPYGIIISAAIPHSIVKNSFTAAFAFKEWFPIFRKGLAQFIVGYLLIIALSFVFTFVIQIAMATIVLMCIIPFIMIPYSAYFSLISNTIYAQAYITGLDALQSESHATT